MEVKAGYKKDIYHLDTVEIYILTLNKDNPTEVKFVRF